MHITTSIEYVKRALERITAWRFVLKMDKSIILNGAQNMIDRYGSNALAEVDLRISELRMQKQSDALELWQNIRIAVQNLSGPSPDESVH